MKKSILATLCALALASMFGLAACATPNIIEPAEPEPEPEPVEEVTPAEEPEPAATGDLADGTYTGSGMGKSGMIDVTITVKDGVITVDEITDPGETPGIGGAEAIADGTYKDQIEAAQGANIDGVAGATLTSDGVKAAVEDAIAQASGGAAAAPAEGGYADGTYTGSGMGKSGMIEVTLTVKDGVITVDEITDPGETPGIGGAEAIADGTYKDQIEAAQGANIDGVAGATLTSDGVKAAVEDALSQAGSGEAAVDTMSADGAYADGTYTGTGTGMGGKINVTIEVKGGKISVTDISPNNETVGIGGYEAIEDGTFVEQIEAAQSAEIDGVTGATITTTAIKTAVEEALEQAAAGDSSAAADTTAAAAGTTAAAASTSASSSKTSSSSATSSSSKSSSSSATSSSSKTSSSSATSSSGKTTSSSSAAAGAYKDGTYTGTGTGMGGKINVTIEVKGGKISVTDISPNNETVGIGGYEAIQDGTFVEQIEAAQSAEIDGVTGATITTTAIKKAVEEALDQAK